MPLYKISQDNLELFFCSIRSHGGFNNNPTVRQFQSAYKKILVHVELRDSFRGNCIPLEELTILKCNITSQLNVTSKEYAMSDNIDDFEKVNVIENDHDYLPDPVSSFSKYIITYISGYVVYYLKKKIICEQCLDALISKTRDLFLFSFIDIKNKNGLQYPSEDVINICLKCEKILKIMKDSKKKISVDIISTLVLKEFINSNVFSNIMQHSLDQFVLDNHRILLIKCIVDKYVSIRLTYLTKTRVNKAASIRHQNNKIVLFKGQ